MTATTLISPASYSSEGCSSEPLFPILTGELQIQATSSSMSLSWGDFPIINECGKEHAYVTNQPIVVPDYFYGKKPAFSWELDSDNDDDTAETESSSSCSDDGESAADTTSASCSSSQHGEKKHRKNVSFSDVLEVRSYEVVLGDHPCCRSLPVQLGWDYEPEIVDFDLYEGCRRFQRRHISQLRLSYWERRDLLEITTGLTEDELLLQEQKVLREDCFGRPSSDDTTKDKAPCLPRSSCSTQSLNALAWELPWSFSFAYATAIILLLQTIHTCVMHNVYYCSWTYTTYTMTKDFDNCY